MCLRMKQCTWRVPPKGHTGGMITGISVETPTKPGHCMEVAKQDDTLVIFGAILAVIALIAACFGMYKCKAMCDEEAAYERVEAAEEKQKAERRRQKGLKGN